MSALRDILLRYRALAALIVAAALVLRVCVPAGFMPMVENGRIVLALCSGYGPVQAAPAMADMPGMAHGHHDQHVPPQADSPCAFGDLALPMLGAIDPIQLAVAILFLWAAALFAVSVSRPAPLHRLRPPPRGPPIPA